MRPRRVLGYVRVSGSEQAQHGTSLEGQRDELAAFCTARGWPSPTVRVEVESGSASRLERRVELAALIAEAREGDVVLVPKVDRWSRDLPYGVASVRALIARGVGWQSTGEGIDASTPNGDSTLGIMAWAADQERKRIRERTVGRRVELRAQGLWVEATVPFGYLREARRLVPGEHAATVLGAFEYAARGASLREVGAYLRARDASRTWAKPPVHALLRSRVYLGEVETVRGVVREHPPLVSHALFAAVQAGLVERKGGRVATSARTEGWILRGLAVCKLCGSRVGCTLGQRRDDGTKREYYACSRRLYPGLRAPCPAPYRARASLDEQAFALTFARLGELRHELAREPRAPTATAAKKGADPAAARARLAAKRARLVELYGDGGVDRAALDQALRKVDDDERALDAKESASAPAPVLAPSARRAMLASLTVLAEAWEAHPVTARRETLRELAERVELGDGVEVTWKSPALLAITDP
jgi:DNA invertase Pin-like site-specific DNA recombinase